MKVAAYLKRLGLYVADHKLHTIISRSPTWAAVFLLPLPAPCTAQHLCNIIRYQVQGLWPAEDKTPGLPAPEPSVREARHVYLQELV